MKCVEKWFVNGLLLAVALALPACGGGTSSSVETVDEGDEAPEPANSDVPTVTLDPTWSVLKELDIIYAEGLVHSETSAAPFSTAQLGEDTPLKLDMYSPDNDSTNRPLFMFIHGVDLQVA